jgi:eukaryotic-like serine/threonine-protein kinase
LALSPGTRLGVYDIAAPIGEGGMGQVYRATDAKLKRQVAIKVLPASLAADADRLVRFQREAEVLASLNHPNIAAIYGLEESGGTTALVMELVEGDDLSHRIAHGAMPLDEALPIAKQIAEALEAAHDQGIIHRDLKPANIKVRADGTVKVLDFGLAKAIDPTGVAGVNVANSPTLTAHATALGMIMGTAAYMAPEQAKGKAVDKRADIWAFGVVLYEMLAGRAAFAGETATDIIAAVVTREPEWTALPAATPASIRRLLSRCLEKDPKRRMRDIGEARIALDDALARPGEVAVQPREMPAPGAGPRLGQRAVPWIIAVAALAVAGFFAMARPSIPTGESVELEIAPPADSQFLIDTNSGSVSLSPDGTRIVFRAETGGRDALWIRSLGRDDAKPLAGTEGAQYQFWAPDSRRLAFFAAGKLKTLDLAAGLPQPIADVINPRGGTWGEGDLILFATGAGAISRVSARGGTPEPVTRLDTGRGENAHYWPLILPGGRTFLYFVRSIRLENSGIYVAAIDGSNPVRLVSSLSSAIYAPPLNRRPGYLLWVQNGDLLAQPFDADRGAMSGEPATIASGVRVLEAQRGVMASVSRTGAIAWATPRATDSRLTWYARDGRRLDALPIEGGEALQLTIAPDGRRLAYTQPANGAGDIFVYDFTTRRSRRVSPSPDYDETPLWSPDGSELLYRGNDQGFTTMMRLRIDGATSPVELMRDKGLLTAAAWSPDRRYVLVLKAVSGLGLETLVFPLNDPKKITPLLTGPADDVGGVFSPDGRWIAFTSDRTGRPESYVVRFRGDQDPPSLGGPPLQISTDGGGVLGWRRDGKEVLLAARNDQVMAVAIDARGESISAGPPMPLFQPPRNHGSVAMTPDAGRFLVAEYPYAGGQTIHVLTNWHQRIK